jgi:hypothetical protein
VGEQPLEDLAPAGPVAEVVAAVEGPMAAAAQP